MSGNKERNPLLPVCPLCGCKPRYYTLGEGQGMVWIYDDKKMNRNHGTHISFRSGTLLIPVTVRRRLKYLYCGSCLGTFKRKDYPDIVNTVLSLFEKFFNMGDYFVR